VNLPRKQEGFTIGELLATVAIVAVLASILLPVFVRGRERGTQVRCASNMRQLGQAFQLYLQDWSGYYPGPGGLRGNYNYWSQSGPGGLVSYVRRNGGIGTIWCCPYLTEWSGPYPPRSYGMNSYLRDPPDVDYPTSVGILRGMPDVLLEDPPRTILLFEGIPIVPAWMDELYYIYRCGNWTCVRGYWPKSMPLLHTRASWQPWHGKDNNYLYADGHLVARPPGMRTKATLSTYAEMYEWWVRKGVMAKKMQGY